MKNIFVFKKIFFLICILSFIFLHAPLAAANAATIDLETNQSHYLDAHGKVTRVAVANPKIADVAPISNTSIMVIAKAPGTTSLSLWTSNGMRQDFTIVVDCNQAAIAKMIETATGAKDIQVLKSGDAVLLRGTVDNQYQKDTAEKIASLYGKTVNLLQMDNPSQVRIEAQIIEINSQDAKNLGIQLFSSSEASTNSAGTMTTTGSNNNSSISFNNSGVFSVGQDYLNSHQNSLWFLNHTANINATLHALITQGKAKILSRPSIATLSGQKASILIGGEIPIPMKGDNGEVSINWHKYGINLNIDPIVNNNDSITSKVHAEVSSLDYTHAVVTNGFSVPAIASREADATINVPSGMTMAIGGLLNSNDSKTVEKIPLLSSLPIIGEFFKHTVHSRDNNEIIILITPTIVKPDTPVIMTKNMKNWYIQENKSFAAMPKVNVAILPKSIADANASSGAISPDSMTAEAILAQYAKKRTTH